MNGLTRPLLQWMGMRSLRVQLLSIVLGLSLTSLLVLVTVSFQRTERHAQEESLRWASLLATLAARVSETPVMDGDAATLDAALTEVLAMPGVNSIEVYQPGGRPFLRVRRNADGQSQSIRPRSDEAGNGPSPGPRWDDSHRSVYITVSLLSAHRMDGGRTPGTDDLLRSGWLQLEYTDQTHLPQAYREWMLTSGISLVLLVAALGAFALFLRRTIRPLGALAQFASELAHKPGETLMQRWGSREVRELGRALNWSSAELARRMTETQQRVSRLHAILDTAADAIIGLDSQGRVVSTNPAAERMFGFSAEQLHGQPIAKLLPGVDEASLSQSMADGMLIHSTQSRIGRIETNAMRHETPFPVEVLLGEIANDHEVRYACIVRDLTDLKLAEDYLMLYGRVLDCSPSGVSVSDARRYPQPIVHINPAFTRITGYEAHEVLGRDASILEGPLTDPDDLALLQRTVRNGGELKVTLRNYRKDGTMFHNKLSVSPVRDASGEITHYINVIEDVSGQVEVKQRLIERTARLNATFDLSPDGFVVFDEKGELITSNPAMRNMVGEVSSWMPMSSFDRWMQQLCESPDSYIPISDTERAVQRMRLVLSRPIRKVLEREVRRHIAGSGETFVYFRDVTQQFEVDQMKSEFLATAAHELRTPLASILGFTELMLHRKYSEEKQKDLLQTVHRQGSLLNNLIQELLDLSRIEARQGKDFHIVPTPLATIVQAAVTGITNQELGREVRMEPMPDLSVMADTSKIEQALTNLLSNAFKYSPNGGEVRLSVSEAERNGQACAVISVCDQGIGMTPEQLARAFERFYRADTSGNIPGTGLGLNLVKEIAEIHGGGVELESRPGEGTTARLWLRLTPMAVVSEDSVPA